MTKKEKIILYLGIIGKSKSQLAKEEIEHLGITNPNVIKCDKITYYEQLHPTWTGNYIERGFPVPVQVEPYEVTERAVTLLSDILCK